MFNRGAVAMETTHGDHNKTEMTVQSSSPFVLIADLQMVFNSIKSGKWKR